MSVVCLIFGVPMIVAAVLISPSALHNLVHGVVFYAVIGLALPFIGWRTFLAVFAFRPNLLGSASRLQEGEGRCVDADTSEVVSRITKRAPDSLEQAQDEIVAYFASVPDDESRPKHYRGDTDERKNKAITNIALAYATNRQTETHNRGNCCDRIRMTAHPQCDAEQNRRHNIEQDC